MTRMVIDGPWESSEVDLGDAQVRLVEEALLRWLSENKRADTKVAQVQRS